MKPSRYYPGPAYFLISVLFIFFCSSCAFCSPACLPENHLEGHISDVLHLWGRGHISGVVFRRSAVDAVSSARLTEIAVISSRVINKKYAPADQTVLSLRLVSVEQNELLEREKAVTANQKTFG